MKELNYRLIVSDFDGTLIDDKQRVPKKVKKAIGAYVANGGIFAVCTGRMLCSILPQVRKLGLKGLVAANQGIVIADIESGNIIKNGGMSCVQAAEVCKYLEELNRPINLYSDDDLFTCIPKSEKYLKTYEKIVCVNSKHVDGAMSEFALKLGRDCQKIAVIVAPSERQLLYDNLKSKFGDRFDVTCSASVLVEISPYGETKGKGLKFLADHFNIPIEKCIAVGDNLNDLSMIEAAGLGVAVRNGEERLKQAAGFICDSNNDGGVAQIIEKYGFA